ncbi:hypothetical protein GCM10027089_11360 [Nocardia thraciensis]
MLWLVIVAGHETTVHLLSNAVVALCGHPEPRAKAVAGDRPARTPGAAEPFPLSGAAAPGSLWSGSGSRSVRRERPYRSYVHEFSAL